MLGDGSGANQLATGLVSLAAMGAALPGQSTKRAYSKAQTRAIEALRSAPEFASVNPDRLLVLLTSKTPSFSCSDLIEASRSADKFDLDAELAKRVHQALPTDDDDEATKRLLYLALEAGMRACNADKAFKDEARSVQILHLVQEMHQVSRKQGETNDKLEVLIRQSADKARELRLTEQLFISLARRIAKDVADIDQAHRELERVVEVAAEEHAKDVLPANTDDAVTAILARVDELNSDGEIDSAADLIAEEESHAEAGLLRLYDKGIAQAILTRDANAACRYELKKIPLDNFEPIAQFDALCRVQNSWFERGRDKGLNFDLEVAVALARASQARARNAFQRGVTFNDLGLALSNLGERESDTERLEEAVAAYRAALKEHTQEHDTLNWAMVQNNLGSVLHLLGERESGTERLLQAVVAYRAALEKCTQKRVPLQWAMTQNNLGNVLRDLGARENNPERVVQAVVACYAALEEYTQERVPLEWAMTLNNLGNALLVIGQRGDNMEALEQAAIAYRAALQEYTQELVPLQWAMTQNNLGNALWALSPWGNYTDRLEQAIIAFSAALEEFTQERVPLRWASTQSNIGTVLLGLGIGDGNISRLEQAVIVYRSALEEQTQERVPLDWAMTMENLALTEKALADHPATEDPRSHLQAALAHVEAALEIFDPETISFNYASATRLRDELCARLSG